MVLPAALAIGAAVTPTVINMLRGDGSKEAEARKQRLMMAAAKQYADTAPRYIDARMQGLQNLAGLFSPVNNALGEMYGQGAKFDMSQMTNPVLAPREYAWDQPTAPQQPVAPTVDAPYKPPSGAVYRSDNMYRR
jgi:hypothetical protein